MNAALPASARPVRFNAFQMNTPSHQSPGLWRHPRDTGAGYRDAGYWVDLARLLEAGGFDAIFLADVLGAYDVYGGNLDAALRHGVQLPLNDPLALAPLIAQATTRLGIGVTASTGGEHPYTFARRISTLDHLSGGRIGWNIVTGYLDSAARNLGQARQLGHDARYDLADEYLEVVYKLWEKSWEDGAVLRDRERGVTPTPRASTPSSTRASTIRCRASTCANPRPSARLSCTRPGHRRAAWPSRRVMPKRRLSAARPGASSGAMSTARAAVRAAGRDPESLLVYAQALVVPGATEAESNARRNNFLALVFCLMFGTAALPHILMRSYTTPSVGEARVSVFWTLFFILLIYLSIPALAVLAKYDIYTSLVGSDFRSLPTWISYWANVDKVNPLISVSDINGDGLVQLAEIAIDGDVLVLATPEIGGLPYVISGLVAAGGLAAALSTADGLLLAISNALSHDVYYKLVDPGASTQKRVTISKLLLLAVAFIAAYAASQKPADILSLVGAAFSLAASTLFPVLVLGVFWKRANQAGAIAGMVAGFLTCLYYMFRTNPALGGRMDAAWFDIAPMSAGIFGVPAGIAAVVLVSLLTAPPSRASNGLVDYIRAPE